MEEDKQIELQGVDPGPAIIDEVVEEPKKEKKAKKEKKPIVVEDGDVVLFGNVPEKGTTGKIKDATCGYMNCDAIFLNVHPDGKQWVVKVVTSAGATKVAIQAGMLAKI